MEHGNQGRDAICGCGDDLSANNQLRIELSGGVSPALVEEMRRRFGPLEVQVLDGKGVITTTILDQPALRALLELLWDGAIDVHSVTRISK